jgi:hypothetical protein
MTDYTDIHQQLRVRTHEISARQKEIVAERARLDSEDQKLAQELAGITQMLDGLRLFGHDDRLPSTTDRRPQIIAPPVARTEVEKNAVRFAEKVREILEHSPKPLFPTQIRDELFTAGFTGKNILVMVHTTIERMGDRVECITVAGRNAFRLKGKGSGPARTASMLNGIRPNGSAHAAAS